MTTTNNSENSEKKSLKEKLKLNTTKKKVVFFSFLGLLLACITLTALSAKHRYSHFRQGGEFLHSGEWNAGHHGKSHRKKGRSGHHRGHGNLAILSQYDLDGNGQLSTTEREQAQTARFNAIDIDQTGQLENEEFLKFFKTSAEQNLKANFILMDIDENNALSKEEYTESRYNHRRHGKDRADFKTVDTDSSGELSSSEFIAASISTVNRRAKARFVMLDRDANNILSQEEFKLPLGPSRAF